MAFTVLKISKIVETRVEVAGEFRNEEAAKQFAEASRLNEPEDERERECEYRVEVPPSVRSPD